MSKQCPPHAKPVPVDPGRGLAPSLTTRQVYHSAQWQRLRLAKLNRSPLCEGCEARGRITPATTVDHVEPMHLGGPSFPPLDGLAAYCASCHAFKDNAWRTATATATGRIMPGFNVDGEPLCPADSWNVLPGSPDPQGGANHGRNPAQGDAADSCADIFFPRSVVA